MKSWTIKDIKLYMKHMLLENTFDLFLLEEAALNAAMKMEFDGHLYKGFYSEEELDERLNHGNCILYADVRRIFLEAIKGATTPESFKFVLKAPREIEMKLANESGYNLSEVGGLYINTTFKDQTLTITAGVSLNVFRTDRELEQNWCDFVQKFLSRCGFDWSE